MIIYIKTYQKGTWIWICLICVVSAKMESWTVQGRTNVHFFVYRIEWTVYDSKLES